MRQNNQQVVDLLISNSQILVRSKPYCETLSQWGQKNIEQGAVIHRDYAIFDPLPDDTFGANVFLTLADSFTIDTQTLRCIAIPFYTHHEYNVEVASATEKFTIDLPLSAPLYSLYYEICEGDEVFYKFTFVATSTPIVAHYMIDDEWGGKKQKIIQSGVL
jgi:hypothetical protein